MTERNLVVREHRGARIFSIAWQADGRRHRLRLGSERGGLDEQSAARAVRLIGAWPSAPTPWLVRIIVRWVLALEKVRADGQA